jgi:hypothetical protein
VFAFEKKKQKYRQWFLLVASCLYLLPAFLRKTPPMTFNMGKEVSPYFKSDIWVLI